MNAQYIKKDGVPEKLMVVLLVTVSGCMTQQNESVQLGAPDVKLDIIKTIELENQSDSLPKSVEQATANLAQELTQVNEPDRSVTLTLDQVRAAVLAEAHCWEIVIAPFEQVVTLGHYFIAVALDLLCFSSADGWQ